MVWLNEVAVIANSETDPKTGYCNVCRKFKKAGKSGVILFFPPSFHTQARPHVFPVTLQKVSIGTLASGVDFLGWAHFPDHRVIRTATKG